MAQDDPKADSGAKEEGCLTEEEIRKLDEEFNKHYEALAQKVFEATNIEEPLKNPAFGRAAYKVCLARAVQFAITFGLDLPMIVRDCAAATQEIQAHLFQELMMKRMAAESQVPDPSKVN